ncbi:MAG: peptide-methionine (S)-S-oxide reductase MsrA [Halioglobus sp.]|nr:peptide-methionine (S)-S-oxide reductase MsrA [Halioglobus sp.]
MRNLTITPHPMTAAFSILALLMLLGMVRPVVANAATAVFAGGCFWCMEAVYQEHEGVSDVISGFTGGTLQNPSYSGNHEGHYEAVQVSYDPAVVSYEELLDLYWRNIDPFDGGGQFCDRGPSYHSAIFVADEAQRTLAQQSRAAVAQRFPEQTLQTPILDADTFWPVEAYHQDYYLKNPLRYKFYRWNCGRGQRLEEIWG